MLLGRFEIKFDRFGHLCILDLFFFFRMVSSILMCLGVTGLVLTSDDKKVL